ncbi:MAG: hypothetical protein KJ749_03025 [Planctomycetes bacterium]|nr:hypothetical protein [Planctomycetota bacterium]
MLHSISGDDTTACDGGSASARSSPSSCDGNTTADADLERIITAWPTLPEAIRRAVVELVRLHVEAAEAAQDAPGSP